MSQYNYPQAPVVYPPPPTSYPPPPGAYVPPGQVYPPPPPPVAAHLSYPPPVQAGYSQGPFVAPPPVGYPMKSGPGYPNNQPLIQKLSTGVGFGRDVVLPYVAAASWISAFKNFIFFTDMLLSLSK
ncbi:leucine-rich repeat extensin-like protein 6 [Juglans microcarpa x Juglans regia]|uniref:leucine-rich repeat extensin-like protein 6 n=1 Tax=Juglans microcarpa x Juglans regia TaxID=2249226 RepID=UPI001B7F5BE3|nr:leucine-rich repeat extensin-like protein 6 [Juglans microcarpa x Juglans regia]